MPSAWYDMRSLALKDDDAPEEVLRKRRDKLLAVDKKPYFMKYIYEDVMYEWKGFVRRTEDNALRKYRTPLKELIEIVDAGGGSEDERTFVKNYRKYLPVSDGGCVVNRICHMVENEFPSRREQDNKFDRNILKCGIQYSNFQELQLRAVYQDYISDQRSMQREINRDRVDINDAQQMRAALIDYYSAKCREVCPNEKMLCDILVDICYGRDGRKQFVWDVCSSQMIANLLERSGGKIFYPVRSEDGNILYKGDKYEIGSAEICS